MSYLHYELTANESEELQKQLANVDKDIENDLNQYLQTKGSKEIIQSIVGFVPVSDRRKKHAKHDIRAVIKASDRVNLGVVIRTGKKYGYLVFPNEGIGYHNPVEQKFFDKGLENVRDKLFKNILKIIEENM